LILQVIIQDKVPTDDDELSIEADEEEDDDAVC
jgi:hypothetical protein